MTLLQICFETFNCNKPNTLYIWWYKMVMWFAMSISSSTLATKTSFHDITISMLLSSFLSGIFLECHFTVWTLPIISSSHFSAIIFFLENLYDWMICVLSDFIFDRISNAMLSLFSLTCMSKSFTLLWWLGWSRWGFSFSFSFNGHRSLPLQSRQRDCLLPSLHWGKYQIVYLL